MLIEKVSGLYIICLLCINIFSSPFSNIIGPSAPAPAAGPFIDLPISNMRQVIARRLLESKTTVPHFYLTVHANADKMLAMRKKINQKMEKSGVRISVNDFILKAVACASMAVPEANAAWLGDRIRQ